MSESKTRPATARGRRRKDKKPSTCNVQVVVRCRPPSKQEVNARSARILSCVGDDQVRLDVRTQRFGHSKSGASGKVGSKQYTFDRVFNQKATQSQVYEQAIKPVVKEVLQGFNCTVFAYGQTGTGKTYTMEGSISEDKKDPHAGVIPRAIRTIFQTLEEESTETKDYSVKVSFLELYNEELSDLLADDLTEDADNVGKSRFRGSNSQETTGQKVPLRIFEDATGRRGTLVHGLEEALVHNEAQVFKLVHKAMEKRCVAATNLNEKSSRSHCIFTITIHTKDARTDGEDIIKTGKLHLVDLAGSECVGRSGAIDQRLKEAGKINRSLLTLGRVINALVDKLPYVPYRDSKLTRLLQDALGGHSKTLVVATVSPCEICVDETLSTLDYAARAKNIKNKPQVNQKMTRSTYMKDLLVDINRLRKENEALRAKNGVYMPVTQYEEMQTELKENSRVLADLQATLSAKEAEFAEVSSKLATTERELTEETALRKQVQSALAATKTELARTKEQLDEAVRRVLALKEGWQRERMVCSVTKRELKGHRQLIRQQHASFESLQGTVRLMHQSLGEFSGQKARLHDKVDDVQRTLAHNQQQVEETHQSAREAINQSLKDDITASFTRRHATQCDNVDAIWGKHSEDFSHAHQTIREVLMSAQKKIVEQSSSVQNAVLKHVETVSGSQEQAQTLAASIAQELLQFWEKNIGEVLTQAHSAVGSALDKHQTSMAGWHAEIQACVSARTESLYARIAAQQSEIKNLRRAASEAAASAQKQISILQEQVTSQVSTLRKSGKTERSALLSAVQELLSAQETRENEAFDVLAEDVSRRCESLDNESHQAFSTLSEGLDEVNQHANTWTEKQSAALKALGADATQRHSQCESQSQKVGEMVSTLHAQTTVDATERFADTVESHSGLWSAWIGDQQKVVGEFKDVQAANISLLPESMDCMLEQHQQALTHSQTQLESSEKALSQETASMRGDAEGLASAVAHWAQEQQTLWSSLQDQKLRAEPISGNTPRRENVPEIPESWASPVSPEGALGAFRTCHPITRGDVHISRVVDFVSPLDTPTAAQELTWELSRQSAASPVGVLVGELKSVEEETGDHAISGDHASSSDVVTESSAAGNSGGSASQDTEEQQDEQSSVADLVGTVSSGKMLEVASGSMLITQSPLYTRMAPYANPSAKVEPNDKEIGVSDDSGVTSDEAVGMLEAEDGRVAENITSDFTEDGGVGQGGSVDVDSKEDGESEVAAPLESPQDEPANTEEVAVVVDENQAPAVKQRKTTRTRRSTRSKLSAITSGLTAKSKRTQTKGDGASKQTADQEGVAVRRSSRRTRRRV